MVLHIFLRRKLLHAGVGVVNFLKKNEITIPRLPPKGNRADIRTLRLLKQISQRGIDTLGLLPIYEM